MELLAVIVIIAILVVMAFPVLNMVKARVSKVRCIANLRSIQAAAGLYLQENNHWPQIRTKRLISAPQNYAQDWIDALSPYGVTRKTWICPTTQELMGGPDYQNDPLKRRVDYIATPFDSQARTPYKWAAQPWFAERGDTHGNGNLLIMPDGSVHELNDYKKK